MIVMKNIFYAILLFLIVGLTACETTQEITVDKNGRGSVRNTTDMSSTFAMVKQFAPQDSGSEKLKLDTSLALASIADSIGALKPEEKNLVKKGNWMIKLNASEEKFVSVLEYPFEKPEQINTINTALLSVIQEKLMDKMMQSGAPLPPGMDATTKPGDHSSFEDYFELKIKDGVVEKKLNKEKYAQRENDQSIMGLKNVSGMGASIKNNYVINLPRPAKKVEGKAATLSPDKKKVTLSVSSDDFFDDPSKFEYKIEY
jgi:hypothetical protein